MNPARVGLGAALALSLSVFGCVDESGPGPGGGGGGSSGPTGEVARIEIPDTLVLEIGQTVPLVPVALDPKGNVVGGVDFVYASSDERVATVANASVTALAEGASFVTVSYRTVTSNRSVIAVTSALPDRGSSDALIAAALAQGTLDAEQALIYRVFAMFGDARLPLEYRSRTQPFESDALDDAKVRWSTLSEPTKKALEPFLVPAFYLGSWASLDRAPRALKTACQLAVGDPNWAWYPRDGTGHVKVWYDKRVTSAALATTLSNEIETKIWDDVTKKLGLNAPLPDGDAFLCSGEDARLDLILANTGVNGMSATMLGATAQLDVWPDKYSPMYITVNAKLSQAGLFASTAHELTHAAQWAYTPTGKMNTGDYTFLKEATAQAAMDFAYPSHNLEQRTMDSPSSPARRDYLETPQQPLDSGPNGRFYASYLFFQHRLKLNRGTLSQIWAQTEKVTGQLKAIDEAMPGKLRGVWPTYARTLWNQPPVSMEPASFYQFDQLTEVPVSNDVQVSLGSKPSEVYPMASTLEPASVRFDYFEFLDAASRTLLFHNTWYQQKAAGKAVSVRALWLDSAGKWNDEDWSDLEWIGFCRDKKDQRVGSLVLVVGSGEIEPGMLTASKPPSLTVSNMPCWGMTGTVERVTRDTSWSSGTAKVTMTAEFEGAHEFTLPAPGQPWRRILISGPQFKQGSATVTENYVKGVCTHTASSAFTLTGRPAGGDTSSTSVMNHVGEPAEVLSFLSITSQVGSTPRAYFLNLTSPRVLMGQLGGGPVAEAPTPPALR